MAQSTGIFSDPGNIRSGLVIAVYGSGEITLMVGFTIIALEGVSSVLHWVRAHGGLFLNYTSMNANRSGDSQTFAPGTQRREFEWRRDQG